jgi:hypothetical protein
MLGKSTMEMDHFQYMISKGLSNETGQELEVVFHGVLREIIKSEYQTVLYHWTNNLNNFKNAYGIVMSRGMTLRLNEYYTLVNLKDSQGKYTPTEVENLKLNQKICMNVGCPCIVLFVDLCNHYQPKYRDLRDKRPIILDTAKDYFLNLSPKEHDIGDEMSYTYSNDPSSLTMLMHYGFVIKDNKFNSIRSRVTDHFVFSLEQLKICKELYCIDAAIKEPQSVPTDKLYLFYGDQFNEQLLNYSKVRALKKTEYQQISPIIKKLKTKEKISFYNELASWIFYMRKVKEDVSNIKSMYNDSIKENQYYRDIVKKIERNWKDEENQRQEWSKMKHFELIAEMDLSYKKILYNHLIGSEKKVIKTLHEDITKIRSTYISQ